MADFSAPAGFEFIDEIEQKYGLPRGYLAQTAKIESNFNPSATTKLSSAGGLFQFLDSTAKQYGLQDKFDPRASTEAAARLAKDNFTFLQRRLGREPTAGELYLAHQQGPKGAADLLLNPAAPAASAVGPVAVRNNGGGPDTTAGDFANKWVSKFGQSSGPKTDMSGIFDVVADPTAPPNAPTEASSQRRQPMRMPSLLGGNEQQGIPSILSGMFDDPQKLAAMEMLVKSLNPFSNVGNSLSRMAEAQRRFDTENSRDKRDYDLRREVFDVNRRDRADDNRRADEQFAWKKSEAGLTDISRYLMEQGLTPGTQEYRDAYKTEWEKKKQSKVYGTPIAGTVDGQDAIGSYDDSGTFRRIDTGNFKPTPGTKVISTPQGDYVVNSKSGAPVGSGSAPIDPTQQPVQGTPGFYPKDVQGTQRKEEVGKIQGQAQGQLPAVEITANRTIKQIDEFIQSPGFNQVFGVVDQFRPNWTMSDAGRDSLARYKQLSGRAFLEGRLMLKGGGAITDFESNKAEGAIARLERSQNEADAKQALEDFKDAVREGAAKLRVQAGDGAAPSAPASTTIPPPPPGYNLVK
jgi:hypothetical protein